MISRLELEIDKIDEIIFNEALPLLKEYYLYMGWFNEKIERQMENVDLTERNPNNVSFFGSESWRYGGYDDWSFTMPVEFLVNPDYRNELKQAYFLKQEKERVNREESAQKAKEAKFKKYLELKEEFEDS
jgi:hypothetical protein